MRSPGRPLLASLVACFAVSGCLADRPAPGRPTTPKASVRPVATRSATPTPGGPSTNLAGAASPGAILAGPPRVVAQAGPVVTLTGKVKVISDHGGGVISDHGGGILSNNGGTVISDHGGGVISDHGGGLKPTYALAQASPEWLLADAVVTLHDAAGRMLVDEAGKPLSATTGRDGGYTLAAVLPAEGVTARVTLWKGGEVQAMLARDAAGRTAGGAGVTLDLDTSSALGAAYVLGNYVKGDQAIFDRLPAREVERLERDLDGARALVGTPPSYAAASLVTLTDTLRAKAPAVDKTLEDIKVLLLGQANLGSGRPATEVALADPRALLVTRAGTLLIGEHYAGRVRRVGADGKIGTYAGAGFGDVKQSFLRLLDLAEGPDGAVYVAEGFGHRVWRIAPDGAVTHLAGNLENARGPAGGPATATALVPGRLAVGPDGTVYVGEERGNSATSRTPPRVLAVAPDGTSRLVAVDPAWGPGWVAGLATGADGSLDVLYAPASGDGATLYRVGADGRATRRLDGLATGEHGDLARATDGTVYVSEPLAGRVTAVAPDGGRRVVQGAGGPAGGGPLESPAALALGADGLLYVCDRARNVVHAFPREGAGREVAGRVAAAQAGDLAEISVNVPGGVAFDDQGRLLFADGGSSTVKRLDGTRVEVVMGSLRGVGDEGVPPLTARLDGPAGLAWRDGELWVGDYGNQRIRRLGKDGLVRTVVGVPDGPKPRLAPGVTLDPLAFAIRQGADLALAPDGTPHWPDISVNQVFKLDAAGRVGLVAGQLDGDVKRAPAAGEGGPAADAIFTAPGYLAFDRAGDMLVSDTMDMRIRRVKAPGGATPTIETLVGKPLLETHARLTASGLGPEGAPVADTLVLAPTGVCVDAAGTVYFAELGTLGVQLFGAALADVRTAFADAPPTAPRVRKITADGRVTTIAGPGGTYFPDAVADDALVAPTALAVDPRGRLVIVDAGANLIRILPAGKY